MDREPIAIIGVGCRFPGAENPEAFWQLLRDGVDAVTEVPGDRWDAEYFYAPDPATPDKMNTRWGGFLEQVDQFDPQFFGIAPREAVSMDPQQRLLLEVTWEALEDAGQIPERLAGTRTGVFIGISSYDYYGLLTEHSFNDAYITTGNTNCIAANRISYTLDFRGPSLAVDTACSSSLVAIHLACQSLWSGESTLALTGGVTVILSPELTVSFTKAGFMAPDGRCKTFDARANGYVRGEGAGVVVLKPLSRALAEGDPIYAVIRGSAVNQDGRSNGLTAPNRWAQEAVLREAYGQAGVSPGRVQYVEAHGTGTKLGDPIEMKALGAVLAHDRPLGHDCTVGSVKTNIGHLEAAAGVAGLIKVALSLKHRQIPPTLHFEEPNPYIPFDKLPLRVQQTLDPWPEEITPALAGISSFGFGGTNAHVVLEEAPATTPGVNDIDRPSHLLTVSAKNEKALRELVHRYEVNLTAHTEASLADVCFTANTGRSHFLHRLAIAADTTGQLCERLGAFAAGKQTAGVVSNQVSSESHPMVAFLFTGQGSQYVNMGRQLYETQPTFRKTLERCDALLRPHLEQPLLSVLYPESGVRSPLDQTAYTQPALFALEYALAKLWKSWGIEPAIVMGHSVGEYVAACVAGIFSLEDGLKLIAQRGRLMQALPQEGKMVAVFADEARVAGVIAPYVETVSIAAVNGPESIVISGASQAIRAVCENLEAEGIKTKGLTVSHAFHSPLMEPMLGVFEQVAREVTYSSPQIGLISNVSGGLATDDVGTPEYWCRHVREPVRFAEGLKTLHRQGYDVFVEIGPKPILLGMGRQCLPKDVGVWLPSLRQGQSDWQQMLHSLGELYVRGAPVDWSGFDQDYARCRVALPTYPFQRQRYWLETVKSRRQATGTLLQERRENGRFPLLDLLHQGDTEQVRQQLEKAGEFSADERRLLPKLLEVLARQHLQQLTPAPINDWIYEIQWQPKPRGIKPIPKGNPSNQPGSWLVFADRGGVGRLLANLLEERGESCILVYARNDCETSDTGVWHVDANNLADYQRLFHGALGTGGLPLRGVVHMWSLDAIGAETMTVADLEAASERGCGSTLHLVQSLVKAGFSEPPPLWLVTRGAQPVGLEAAPLAVAQAPLWGLGRVIALEHSDVWGGLVDLDPVASEDEVARLLEEIWEPDGEDQVAFRGGQRHLARLVRSSQPELQGVQFQSDATYLITGGLGFLGLRLARWFIEQGARHLVLTGRGGLPERDCWATLPQNTDTWKRVKAVQALEERGATVVVLQADVSDQSQQSRVFEQVNTAQPPLRGIVHAAGVPGYQAIQDIELDALESVLRPKAVGAWILHQLTRDMSLDFFVCFSSVASVWGAKGQGHYGAANHFLDALAHYRRSIGLPALSMNLGPVAGGGMVTEEYQRLLTQIGLEEIQPEQGFEAMGHLLATGAVQTAMAKVDWSKFKGIYETRGQRSLLEQIEAQRRVKEKASSAEKTKVLQRLENAPRAQRQSLLEAYLRQAVAEVLRIGQEDIHPGRNLMEYGLDSIMAMELAHQFSRDFEFNFYPNEILKRSTVNELVAYLVTELDHTRGQGMVESPSSPAISPPDALPAPVRDRTRDVSKPTEKNSGIIFLLSGPRCGSTLLRVMLAGHPTLFCPPELHLLPFKSMTKRSEALGLSYLSEGLQRAFMELKRLDVDQSKLLIEQLTKADMPIQRVYGMLQELAGDRLLVDKSPSYAMDVNALERGELLFEKPRYINLIRHPYAMIESFVRMRLDKVMGAETDDPYALAEQVWATTNRNVLDFFRQIEPERQHLMYYEQLVSKPEKVMRSLCEFLKIPFDEAILKPYEGRRMTDGVHNTSLSIGDPNFLKHDKIEPELGEAWKEIKLPRRLGGFARRVAAELQYKLPTEAGVSTALEEREEILL